MRLDDADEFAGSDEFGFLPKLWEMALIAGDQVVRAGGIGAFEENVTVEALSFDALCVTTLLSHRRVRDNGGSAHPVQR